MSIIDPQFVPTLVGIGNEMFNETTNKSNALYESTGMAPDGTDEEEYVLTKLVTMYADLDNMLPRGAARPFFGGLVDATNQVFTAKTGRQVPAQLVSGLQQRGLIQGSQGGGAFQNALTITKPKSENDESELELYDSSNGIKKTGRGAMSWLGIFAAITAVAIAVLIYIKVQELLAQNSTGGQSPFEVFKMLFNWNGARDLLALGNDLAAEKMEQMQWEAKFANEIIDLDKNDGIMGGIFAGALKAINLGENAMGRPLFKLENAIRLEIGMLQRWVKLFWTATTVSATALGIGKSHDNSAATIKAVEQNTKMQYLQIKSNQDTNRTIMETMKQLGSGGSSNPMLALDQSDSLQSRRNERREFISGVNGDSLFNMSGGKKRKRSKTTKRSKTIKRGNGKKGTKLATKKRGKSSKCTSRKHAPNCKRGSKCKHRTKRKRGAQKRIRGTRKR